ncbi:lipid A deacylase LpxR family protein [Shewanella sp.]|uniref:lipid A deacylase LpxR family protein n=1 Tax=Shewanella sp. TaxID=50422 RepID=UPI0025E19234|nr:lipid A deacylase LpxR family protein [Shewanella sp.]
MPPLYSRSQVFASGLAASLALASPIAHAGQWHIQVDNDIIFGDDGNYTNAIILGWESQAEADLSFAPMPAQWLGALTFSQADAEHAWGWKVSQQMWTPGMIEVDAPQAEDRPYAGYLAFEGHTATYSARLAQKNWLSLGVVGPASANEQVQSFVHKITGSSAPQGWQYQVENQLTLQAAYEIDSLFMRGAAFNNDFLGETQWDIGGFSHTQLGNFRSQADLGLSLRWGNELANSFGRLSQHAGQYGNLSATSKSSSFMVYSRVYLGYRFNDLTLDGSLPYDSQVELENRQAGINTGIIWAHPGWSIAWTFNSYTKEYKSDTDKWHGYGSLVVSWNL